MKKVMDGRSFLNVAAASLGMGALYQFGPLLGGVRAGANRQLLQKT